MIVHCRENVDQRVERMWQRLENHCSWLAGLVQWHKKQAPQMKREACHVVAVCNSHSGHEWKWNRG